MSKSNKVFLIIITILIIILIIVTNYCLHYAKTHKTAATKLMEVTERINKIEEDYNRSMENVKIEIEKDSITSTGTTISIKDNNKTPYIWKEDYSIEKKENDKWKELELLSNTNFSKTAYKLDENNEIKQSIDWGNSYGELTNGIYRIVKHIYTSDSDLYFQSNEFEIK